MLLVLLVAVCIAALVFVATHAVLWGVVAFVAVLGIVALIGGRGWYGGWRR